MHNLTRRSVLLGSLAILATPLKLFGFVAVDQLEEKLRCVAREFWVGDGKGEYRYISILTDNTRQAKYINFTTHCPTNHLKSKWHLVEVDYSISDTEIESMLKKMRNELGLDNYINE